MPTKWRSAYFAQFTVLCIIGTGYICWYHVTHTSAQTNAEIVRAIILDIGPVGLSAAIISFINTDSARFIMVLGGYLEQALNKRHQRQIAEATQKGRQEAQSETNEQWRAWNQRRLDAEAHGLPFDEPIPDQTDQAG